MAIKRYSPKYKKLARFYHPLKFEKRLKIRKFNKQKWERAKRLYFPRRLKLIRQDVSAYPLTRRYFVDRTIRLKKTYRNTLRDKQRLQLYYGCGRLRFFQLKNLTKKIRSRLLSRGLTPAKAMLTLLEDRLDVVLYRLSLVTSIPQARKLIQDGRVCVGTKIVTTSNYFLKPNDILSIDPLIKDRVLGLYLRQQLPYFFFRYKEDRREFVAERKEIWQRSLLGRSKKQGFFLWKKLLLRLKKKTNDSI